MKCIACDAESARYRCPHCRSAYCSSACFKAHRAELDREVTGTGTSEGVAEHATSSSSRCHAIQLAQAPAKAIDAEEEKRRQLRDPFSDASLAAAMSLPTSAAQGGSDGLRRPENQGQLPAETLSSKQPRSDEDGGERERERASEGEGSSPKHRRREGEGQDDGGEEEGLVMLKEAHLRALANDKGLRQALKDTALQKLLSTIDRSRSRLDALEAALYNNADFRMFCESVKATIALAERVER